MGRATLKKLNVGKYVFDEEESKKFRDSLPANLTGIVLKRKFPKVENETYYYQYMYSVWIRCVKEEVPGEISTKLNIPFDPLFVDWLGNKKEMDSNDTFAVTSTPIFLLGNKGPSGSPVESVELKSRPIFFIILGIVIGLLLLALICLYCYRRFVRKREILFDKQLVSYLLK